MQDWSQCCAHTHVVVAMSPLLDRGLLAGVPVSFDNKVSVMFLIPLKGCSLGCESGPFNVQG